VLQRQSKILLLKESKRCNAANTLEIKTGVMLRKAYCKIRLRFKVHLVLFLSTKY